MSAMTGQEAVGLIEATVTAVLFEDRRCRRELVVDESRDVKLVVHAAAEIIAGLLDVIAGHNKVEVIDLWRAQQLSITQGRLEGRAL